MTVGFGEAGGVPPSYSIISDYFLPAVAAEHWASTTSPPIVQRWESPLVLPSLLLSVGATRLSCSDLSVFSQSSASSFSCLSPSRRPGSHCGPGAASKTGFRQTLTMFISRPSLMLVALASGATQFVTYGMINFAVLFLMREKGMTLHQVAVYYALVVAIGMGGSMLAPGGDRPVYAALETSLCPGARRLAYSCPPFYLAFVWAPSWRIALLFLTGTMFLNYFYLTSAVTLVQEEVRPDQRVMSGALLLLIMNLIGLGLGPTFIGAASDFFHASHPHHSLQIALYLLASFYVVAVLLFLALARVLRNESRTVGETVQ